MKEFNLDLLIGKKAVVNCKTEDEANEFLKYLKSKNIKWCSKKKIFDNTHYNYREYNENTCFGLEQEGLEYSPVDFYENENYKILSLDDLVIKPKNNFKEYGFEADFEGEIKFIDSFGHYIGICEWSKEMPTKTKDKQTIYWAENKCYLITLSGILRIPSRDLNPIKKEWYENHDNIGKFVIDIETNEIFKLLEYIKEINQVKIGFNECHRYYISTNKVRPATKEEVLKLLVKE